MPLLPRSDRSPVRLVVLLMVTVGLLAGCGPTISTFSETAYRRATSLKVDALTLMESATAPYEEHASDVRALRQRLKKAHEYARGRPDNEITARQWAILIDPEGNLLGGFLQRWKRESALSEAFVSEKRNQIEEAFDTIIELESGKRRPDRLQDE